MPPKPNRRSMGTKSNMMSAVRMSIENKGQGQMDSAPRYRASSSVKKGQSAGSRLPRPGQGQPRSRSTLGRVSSQSNLYQTPSGARSQSGSRLSTARTPQRVLQVHNANRMSMGSNRGSMVGAKVSKDNRSLGDKLWQRQTIQELIAFLHENGYKLLSTSDFPTNTTQFRNIFEYLFNYLSPGYEMPKRQMELELPGLLQKIGYPIQVSKSTFQTIGTPHSWPAILGVLHYLMKRAEGIIQMEKETAIHGLIFPCKDDHGFDMDRLSDDAIVWKHNLQWYMEFNQGMDENGEEQSRQLEADFLSNYKISDLGKLRHERKRLRKELETMKENPTNCERAIEERDSVKSDLVKLKDFHNQMKEYKTAQEKKLKSEKNVLHQKQTEKEEIEFNIERLKEKCREKQIPVDNNTIHIQTKQLLQQMEIKKEKIAEVEKRIWSIELALGKISEKEDNFIAKFGSAIRKLDLENMSEWMDAINSPAQLFKPLQAMRLEKQNKVQDAQICYSRMTGEINKKRSDLKSKTDTLAKLENDHTELLDNLAKRETEIEEEDQKLTQEISALKTKLYELKSSSGKDLEALKNQFESLKVQRDELNKKVKEDEEKYFRHIQEQMKKAESYVKEKEEQKRQMYKEFEELAKREIEKNKAYAKELKEIRKKFS